MVNLFKIERLSPSKTRKAPLLPRLGIVVEIGHRRYSYRHVPVIETLINLIEQGPSFSNFRKIMLEQLYEVNFPKRSRRKTVNVKAKTVEQKEKKSFGRFGFKSS